MHPTSWRRRIAALAVAAATTMTVLTVAPQAQGQTVGTLRTGENVRLGSPPASRVRDVPGLAVNPANPRHIVEVEQDILAGNCSVNVSRDGGATWNGGPITPGAGFPPPNSQIPLQSCPAFNTATFEGSVAFGSGEKVYVAYASADHADFGLSTLVARSINGGDSFVASTVAMENPNAANPSYIRPKLAVHKGVGFDGKDRIYVSAQANVNVGGTNVGRVYVTVSNDGGDTWSTPPVEITGAGSASPCAQSAVCTTRNESSGPVVNPDGTVSVAYRRTDPNPGSGPTAITGEIQIAKATYPATTWTQKKVTAVSGYVDEAASRFNGSNFPRIAGNPTNGNIYIVYMEGPPPGGRLDHFIHPDVDVMFTRSTDGGENWSTPKRVNDDPPGSGAPATGPAQRHPRVSVAPNGRVDLVWQDRRHGYRSPTHSHLGNGEARMGDTYFTYSLDDGQNFTPNRRVSDKSQNLDVGYDHYGQAYWSWGPALAELGNDEILFAWVDSREGNFDNENADIYLSKLNLQAPATIPVQRLPEANRTGLSIGLSKYAYGGGPQAVLNIGFTNRSVTRPVIVNEGDTLGALVGAVLSRAHLGPLLAAPAAGLPADLKAEVTRMSPIGAFVIGGESALAPAVVTDLVSAGVPADEIVRYTGSPAEIAKAVALGVDRRTPEQKAAGVPAFDAVVVVNPASPEALAAAGLAASLRLPILFSDQGSVPTATRDALTALNITTTLVVGDSGVISDAVTASFPGPKRLGGTGLAGVTQSVLAESVARRLPVNIVNVADSDQPVDVALHAAAAARAGALLVATPGADVVQAEAAIDAAGLRARVDRLVVARSQSGPGYRLVARDGGIFAYGGAGFFGSTGSMRLARPMVGIATTPTNLGYWTVAADGGVFAFGDARFFGSTGGMRLAQPVVGMAPTPSGNGYWLVAADGGVFAFGDARFLGSTGASRLARPMVGIAPTPSGNGYWLVAADGGVFAYGDAPFRGSTGGMRLAQPIVGITPSPSGNGYRTVASDGGVFAFGDATFKGSMGGVRLAQPVVGMDTTPSGQGYVLTAADGGVFAFGDARFVGSAGASRLNQPVVGVSTG